ncbi:MAG: hypothetical protein PHW65_00145 [Dehalococcoidales bacterium]|nr:hypothetical protein [Dehalococcoidales bacterium]
MYLLIKPGGSGVKDWLSFPQSTDAWKGVLLLAPFPAAIFKGREGKAKNDITE